jgi:hypothetical protein
MRSISAWRFGEYPAGIGGLLIATAPCARQVGPVARYFDHCINIGSMQS